LLLGTRTKSDAASGAAAVFMMDTHSGYASYPTAFYRPIHGV
jgi:hypothetical protein